MKLFNKNIMANLVTVTKGDDIRYVTPEQAIGFKSAGFNVGAEAPVGSVIGRLPKSEVGVINTKDAIGQINTQKTYENQTYPQQPVQTQPNQQIQETPQESTGSALYVNQAGQEVEYNQAQLNDPTTQKYLNDNGFTLVSSKGLNAPTTGTMSSLQSGVDNINNKIEELATDFQNYKVDEDPDFQAQAQQIKTQFDKLRRETQQTNFQRQRAYSTLGSRFGTSQYAGDVQMGIEGEELNQANQRIADVNSQEASTLSAARSAYKTGKYEEYNKLINSLKDVREAKSQALTNYNTAIANVTKRMQEENKNLQDNVLKGLQIQELQQKIVQSNLDTYSVGLLDFNPQTGETILPNNEDIAKYAEKLGVNPTQLYSTLQKKAYDLSKMSQEDRKRELDITKAQQDLIPEKFREYQFALDSGKISKGTDFFDYLSQEKAATESAPNSYREWEKAGGQSGTGKSYAEWISKETETGMTPQQTTTFLNISNKYQADSVIEAGNRGYLATQISDEIIANPGNAANQISLLYTFIKNLDPESAVREGELDLAQTTQSYLGKFQKSLAKLAEGKAISNDAAVLLAQETKSLANKWFKTAQNRENQFKSQANIAGVGESFNEYLDGFNQQYKPDLKNTFNSFYENTDETEKKKIQDYLSNPDFGDTPEEAMRSILKFYNQDISGFKENGGGKAILQSFKEGMQGGQCGDFTHKIVNIPSMGNYFTEKQKSVDKFGYKKEDWEPKVGDVVITDASDLTSNRSSLPYGHAAVVAEIKGTYPNIELVLIESNAKGDEKITKGRTLSFNDSAIYGALRGTIKDKFIS